MQKSTDFLSGDDVRFSPIYKVFLDCGYYRVLVNGLTDFDKMIGGLAWCVVASGHELAINQVIQFHENANIGFKM